MTFVEHDISNIYAVSPVMLFQESYPSLTLVHYMIKWSNLSLIICLVPLGILSPLCFIDMLTISTIDTCQASLGERLPLFYLISLLNIHLPPKSHSFWFHFLPIIFSLKRSKLYWIFQ